MAQHHRPIQVSFVINLVCVGASTVALCLGIIDLFSLEMIDIDSGVSVDLGSNTSISEFEEASLLFDGLRAATDGSASCGLPVISLQTPAPNTCRFSDYTSLKPLGITRL